MGIPSGVPLAVRMAMKAFFGFAIMHMNVVRALLTHGGLPLRHAGE